MTTFPRCRTVTVAQDGTGDYPTLSAAAAAQTGSEPVRFLLRRGVYRERPFLELPNYRIEGESRDGVVLSAGIGGKDPWPGEAKTGTFRSWTLFLGGGHAELANLTVENTAGDGALRGQALAVYADADEVLMENVTLLGNQDTLFTAPLPLRVREPNGFRGPREAAPRRNTSQFYRNCKIAGNIDFIFGGADAVFYRCEIVPVPHQNGACYIAVPCTPQGQPGYLFAECTVRGTCAPGSVYLGRPWRKYARAYWLDCSLSEEIAPAGWDPWSDPENEITAQFGEAGSTGPGAAPARAFGSVNNAAERAYQSARLAAWLRRCGE